MKRVPRSAAIGALAAAALAAPFGGASSAAPLATSNNPAPTVAAEQSHADSVRAHLKLPSTEKLIVRSVLSDPDGTVHVRYDRTFQGLRVLGGDLIVTRAADREQVIWNATGRAAVPSTTPAFARAKAEALGAQRSVAGGESTTSTLVVDARQGAPRLAYDVLTTGTTADQTPSRFHTIVDATTGAVRGTHDEIETGTGYSMYSGTVTLNTVLSGSTWLLKDSHGNYTTDLNGATSGTGTQFTDADNVWATAPRAAVRRPASTPSTVPSEPTPTTARCTRAPASGTTAPARAARSTTAMPTSTRSGTAPR